MRAIIEVDGNGVVIGDGYIDDAALAVAPPFYDVTNDPAYAGLGSLNHYTCHEDGTFTAPPAAPALRIIPYDQFILNRITRAEHTFLRRLMQTDVEAQAFWDRLEARRNIGVDLDHPELVEGLAYMKAAVAQARAEYPNDPTKWPWASDQEADARIAAIRA